MMSFWCDSPWRGMARWNCTCLVRLCAPQTARQRLTESLICETSGDLSLNKAHKFARYGGSQCCWDEMIGLMAHGERGVGRRSAAFSAFMRLIRQLGGAANGHCLRYPDIASCLAIAAAHGKANEEDIGQIGDPEARVAQSGGTTEVTVHRCADSEALE